MKLIGTITLETERLILRRFKIDDVENVYQNWAHDSLVSKNLSWETHQNIDETKSFLTHWINEYTNPFYFHWAVELKRTGEIIGNIHIQKVDLYNKRCNFSNCYGSKYWNHGYATEAGKVVIRFLLEDVGFHLIEGLRYDSNTRKGNFLTKLGMKYDGTLRERVYDKPSGKICDCHYYSITREDLDGLSKNSNL